MAAAVAVLAYHQKSKLAQLCWERTKQITFFPGVNYGTHPHFLFPRNRFAWWQVDRWRIGPANMTEELEWEIAADGSNAVNRLPPWAGSRRWSGEQKKTKKKKYAVRGLETTNGLASWEIHLYSGVCLAVWQFSQVITLGCSSCCLLSSNPLCRLTFPKFSSSLSDQKDIRLKTVITSAFKTLFLWPSKIHFIPFTDLISHWYFYY